MGIKTKSKFFYGFEVNDDNNLIAIDEGAGRVDALLVNGAYTLAQYIDMVNTVLNDVYVETYVVTIDRSNRLVSISTSSSVTLLIADIASGVSGFTLLGFTGGNLSGLLFTGDSPTGSEYLPQFLLQRFVDADYNKKYEGAKVNIVPKGNKKEIITSGRVGFYEFIIDWINDFEFLKGAPIESNPNGLQDAIDFMDWVTDGKPLEFIRDRDFATSFRNVLIEKTKSSSNGTGYKLNEKKGLQDYYDTGLITFRDIT